MEAEKTSLASIEDAPLTGSACEDVLFNLLSSLAGTLLHFSEEFGLSTLQVFHHSLEINSPGDIDRVVRELVDSNDQEKLLRLVEDIRIHHISLIGAIDQVGIQVLSQLESDDSTENKSRFLKSDRKIRNRMVYYRDNGVARQKDMVIPGLVMGYRSSAEKMKCGVRRNK
jgi:hypothetical protein